MLWLSRYSVVGIFVALVHLHVVTGELLFWSAMLKRLLAEYLNLAAHLLTFAIVRVKLIGPISRREYLLANRPLGSFNEINCVLSENHFFRLLRSGQWDRLNDRSLSYFNLTLLLLLKLKKLIWQQGISQLILRHHHDNYWDHLLLGLFLLQLMSRKLTERG